jgi:hypothetical protein
VTPGVCGCPSGQVSCMVGAVNGVGGVLTCIDPTSNSEYCGATLGSNCQGTNAGTDCSTVVGSTCGGGGTPQVCGCANGGVECAVTPGGGGPTGNPNTNTCIDPGTNNQFCGATTGCVVGTSAGQNCSTIIGSSCGAVTSGHCGCPPNGVGVAGVSCSVTPGGGGPAGNPLTNTCIDPSTNNAFCGATTGCAAATTLPPTQNGYINCGGTGLGSITGSSCDPTGNPSVPGRTGVRL